MHIAPTIGRKVWYRPNGEVNTMMTVINPSVPMDATIVYVWDDYCVNLLVTDHVGYSRPIENVRFRSPHETFSGDYCEWMPFQVGQAKAVADVGKVGAGSPT